MLLQLMGSPSISRHTGVSDCYAKATYVGLQTVQHRHRKFHWFIKATERTDG